MEEQRDPIDSQRGKGHPAIFVVIFIAAVLYFMYGGVMAFLALIVGVRIVQYL